MNIIYITALFGIEIKDKLKNPIEMKKDIFISNNPTHIKPYLKAPALHAIGQIEADYLLSGNPVIYQVSHVLVKDQVPDGTVHFLREVQAFLMSLWLIRDCGVNCELAFAVADDDEYIHSNSLTIFNERSDGKNQVHVIDSTELNKVSKIYSEYMGGLKNSEVPDSTIFQKGFNRIGVSFSHLQSARSGDDLAIKIAYFCTFFEALLSTTTNELTHQVSERAAHILGKSKEDKIVIYKGLKNVYGVRSRIFHGENISKKQLRDITEVSIFADKIARQLINKVLEDEDFSNVLRSTNSADIEEYMLNIIFD